MPRADFRFALPHRVRYAEVDSQAIVFYGNYLTFLDNALTDYVRQFGFVPGAHVAETGADFHIVKAEIEYRAPIPLDAEIDICVRTVRIGRSSLTFAGEIHPRGADDCRARATLVWVYTDQASHKSTPLPPAFVDGITAFEGLAPARG
jgi:acyl-CoA thioester hydrolase